LIFSSNFFKYFFLIFQKNRFQIEQRNYENWSMGFRVTLLLSTKMQVPQFGFMRAGEVFITHTRMHTVIYFFMPCDVVFPTQTFPKIGSHLCKEKFGRPFHDPYVHRYDQPAYGHTLCKQLPSKQHRLLNQYKLLKAN